MTLRVTVLRTWHSQTVPVVGGSKMKTAWMKVDVEVDVADETEAEAGRA